MGQKREETIELQGPEDPTLTPPPQRQTGILLILGFALMILVGVLGLMLVQPELFVGVVQAFVGGF